MPETAKTFNVDSENIARAVAKAILTEIIPTLQNVVSRDPKGLRDVQPQLLNIEQTAKYLGRTVKGVRDLERKGILVPVRFDRRIQFRVSDLDSAIERFKI